MAKCAECGAEIKKEKITVNESAKEITLPKFTCAKSCPRRIRSERSTRNVHERLRKVW